MSSTPLPRPADGGGCRIPLSSARRRGPLTTGSGGWARQHPESSHHFSLWLRVPDRRSLAARWSGTTLNWPGETRLIIPATQAVPELCVRVVPPGEEGAGNAGCWPHPQVLRAKKMHLCARKQQQGSRNNRHSLRDGLRLIRDLLGAPGFWPPSPRARHTKLDPSIGGSGPHDFAVRSGAFVSCADASIASPPPRP